MLNPEILHKIEYRTQDENGKKQDCCYVDGEKFDIQVDHRGKKSKFWILDKFGQNAYLVKYEQRNTRSLEDAGQFIMCGVFKQIGESSTEYLVCDFEKDGVKYDAILSKNYRENGDVVEFSGYTLNNKFLTREFDNSMGVTRENQHNVKEYMHYLRSIYGRNMVDFDKIEQTLKEYCLLQYVFMMSDLHFYNLSFMYDEKFGHKSLVVVPFYDCGNICTLNLSKEKLENNLIQLEKTRKKGVFLDSLYHKKMPLFGLNSNICVFEKDRKTGSYLCCKPLYMATQGEKKEEVATECLDIFRRELALELLQNPKFRDFYEKMKKNVDLNAIYEHYNGIKEGTIPPQAIKMVEAIFNHNVKQLDKTIKKVYLEIMSPESKPHTTKELKK